MRFRVHSNRPVCLENSGEVTDIHRSDTVGSQPFEEVTNERVARVIASARSSAIQASDSVTTVLVTGQE